MNPLSALVLSASSIDDLAAALRSYNCVVPERAAGRTNDHVERYSIVRLLGTIAWAPADFPLKLLKRERPDFLLDCGGRSIGIEHTETLTENAGKEASLRSKGHGPEAYFPRPMILGETRKSSRQLIGEIEANKMGTGWCGDSVERSWVDAMLHFFRDKSVEGCKRGYQRFAHNWLIMYDNWNAPALNREKAIPRLHQQLQDPSNWQVFERLFILDDRVLIDLDRTTVRLGLVRDPST